MVVDTVHLMVLDQEDLVVAVADHQLAEVVEFNHNNPIQVGHNMDIMVEQEESTTGLVAAAVALVAVVDLLHLTTVETVVLEETSLNSLQHLVMVDISVVVAAVAVMLIVVVTELVELAAVDKVVVMNLRVLWMLCTEMLKPVVAVVEEETTRMVLVMADLVS